MTTTTFHRAVCSFVLLAMLLPTVADAKLILPLSQETLVVLIGIDKYDSGNISSLQYCKADVQLLKETFLACGVDAECIITMTDDAEDVSLKPTKTNIQNTLAQLKNRNASRIIVYFSGHGVTDDGASMLIPMDFDPAEPKTGLPISDLVASLQECKADSRLLLLDTCLFQTTDNKKALMLLPPRTVLFSAAKPGFQAFQSDKLKNGVFTHYLAKGLLGEADRKGDANGDIDIAELYIYVKTQFAAHDEFNRPMVPGLIVSNDIDDIFDIKITTGGKR